MPPQHFKLHSTTFQGGGGCQRQLILLYLLLVIAVLLSKRVLNDWSSGRRLRPGEPQLRLKTFLDSTIRLNNSQRISLRVVVDSGHLDALFKQSLFQNFSFSHANVVGLTQKLYM